MSTVWVDVIKDAMRYAGRSYRWYRYLISVVRNFTGAKVIDNFFTQYVQDFCFYILYGYSGTLETFEYLWDIRVNEIHLASSIPGYTQVSTPEPRYSGEKNENDFFYLIKLRKKEVRNF